MRNKVVTTMAVRRTGIRVEIMADSELPPPRLEPGLPVDCALISTAILLIVDDC
jgi:hypothetical protein